MADYVHETNHHVLYRVTPVYEGDNLVASGVIMEAASVKMKKFVFMCLSTMCSRGFGLIMQQEKAGRVKLQKAKKRMKKLPM